MNKPKPTIPFSPPPGEVMQAPQGPVIHPAVRGSPEAIAYAMGAQARLGAAKQQPILKYTTERAGSPLPIPPLEQAPHEGMTMAEQAPMFGPPPAEVAAQAAQRTDSIVQSGPQSLKAKKKTSWITLAWGLL